MASATTQTASLYLSPASNLDPTRTPGTNVTVDVYINNVSNMFAWEVNITYDTKVLTAMSFEVAPLWETFVQQGKGYYIEKVSPSTGSALLAWLFQRQPNGSLPSLSTAQPVLLGTATFTVQSLTGETQLHMVTSTENPNFGTILLDTAQAQIPYVSSDATFANNSVPGDVNGDGKVNIIDLSIVAIAFGSVSGSPSWNPKADLNNDGTVDIIDLTMVAAHFN